MQAIDYILLYVENPPASAVFYRSLLGREPVEDSPTFVLFVLPSGLKLGLWARSTVEPAASFKGGGAELAMAVADEKAVRESHAAWQKMGIAIAQAPTAMDFGFTFTGLDPDGHRLRVFAPA